MADRLFNQFQGTMEKGVVTLFGCFTGAGAADMTKVFGKGFTSITYHASTTGLFLVTLEDQYQKLLGASFSWSHGDAKPAAPFVNIKSSEVATTAKTLHLEFSAKGDGDTATDPATGDILYITLFLSNSSAL